MENQQRIEEAYAEAVSGMQEQWFVDQHLNWYDYIAALPKRLRVTYVIIVLHRQVMNGGFDQYFANGYGLLFVEFAVSAFAEIGAINDSVIVAKAERTLRKTVSQYSLEWNRATLKTADIILVLNVPEVEKDLGHLDMEYYNSDTDLTTLLGTYLQTP